MNHWGIFFSIFHTSDLLWFNFHFEIFKNVKIRERDNWQPFIYPQFQLCTLFIVFFCMSVFWVQIFFSIFSVSQKSSCQLTMMRLHSLFTLGLAPPCDQLTLSAILDPHWHLWREQPSGSELASGAVSAVMIGGRRFLVLHWKKIQC